MIETVLADASSAASMAIETVSSSNGSSATPMAAAAAAAAVAAPCLADAVWREFGECRKRRAVPSFPSQLNPKTKKILTSLRGGGSTAVIQKTRGGGKVAEPNVDKSLATRGKAVACMAVAMACHYLGKFYGL